MPPNGFAEIYYVCQYHDDPEAPPVPLEQYPSFNLAQARCDQINANGQSVDHMVYVVPRSLMWAPAHLQEDDR